MAYNDLSSKIEAAGKSLVDALSLGITVNTGADDDTIALPAVFLMAEGLQEIEQRSLLGETCVAQADVVDVPGVGRDHLARFTRKQHVGQRQQEAPVQPVPRPPPR